MGDVIQMPARAVWVVYAESPETYECKIEFCASTFEVAEAVADNKVQEYAGFDVNVGIRRMMMDEYPLEEEG